MLDLSPSALAIVQRILSQYVPDHQVWAFGSRAKGTARRYSDLDLAIITQTPLPFEVIGAMREAFSDSDLPFRVDIIDWAATQDNFRRVVEAEKVILHTGAPNPPG
jgi:predicted nucleotidyltransferase